MRNIFLFVFFSLRVLSFSQTDTILLKEAQIIGSPTKLDPTTSTLINIDSVKYLYQGNDPFFILNKTVPNVISQSDNGLPYGYSYLRIRGIDQTRINFTLNGIPLNEMEDQGIYFSNMPDFLNNISRSQITRGIGISKYGTTSIGGSVNLETDFLDSVQISGELGTGSFETNRYSLGYSSGDIKNFSFSSRIGYLSTDGFRDHSGSNGYNYFGQLGYFGKKDKIKVYGFIGESSNQLSWIPIDRQTLNQNYRINLNGINEVDKFKQNLISLNWITFRVRNLIINSSIYHSGINGSYKSYLDPILLGRFSLISNQGGGMINFGYKINNLSLNLGINYNLYRRYHILALDDYPDDVIYKNFGTKRDLTTFIKLNYEINKYCVFADIQYRNVTFEYTDKFNYSIPYKWSFINPKVGIKKFGNNNESWFSLGHTQREVTRSDLFNGNDNLYVFNGGLYTDSTFGARVDVNITPEKVYDLEIGHKFQNNNLFMSVNCYYMLFRDERLMVQVDDITGLPIRQIVDKSIRTGIEFDGYIIFNKLKIGSNGAYSYNRILSLNRMSSLSPNFIMNNSISYRIGKITKIGISGNYVSSMYLDNTQSESTNPYYVINATGGVDIESLSINLIVNNVLNQKYYLPGGVYNGVGQYYPSAFLNYFLSIRFNL